MGSGSLLRRLRECIGGLGWRLFIRCNYGGVENHYFAELREFVLVHNWPDLVPEDGP